MTTPTIGRIVHFTMPSSTVAEPKVRPAIVTQVFVGVSHVDLEVMLVPEDLRDLNPTEAKQLKHRASVNQGKGYPAPKGEWQWPPEVSRAIVAETAKTTAKAIEDGLNQEKQAQAHLEAEQRAVDASMQPPPPVPTAPGPAPSTKPAPARRKPATGE